MSPQFEAHSVTLLTTSEYSQGERKLLLRLAHRSIEVALQGEKVELTAPSPHLAEMRGAFTTLHLHGRLRGCIGYVVPTHSLYRTVAETAQAAAFDDPRFSPVTAEEAPDLKIEISVLSPLQPIRPEQVVIGVHGLVVTKDRHRGLLLPQVPVQWQWDRETFLAQTCLKAGLPADVWIHGIDLQAFTAEVFGDQSPAGT
jgi:uncharacterized protein